MNRMYLSLDEMWSRYSELVVRGKPATQRAGHRLLAQAAAETLPYPVDVAGLIELMLCVSPNAVNLAQQVTISGCIRDASQKLFVTEGPWICEIPWAEIKEDFDAQVSEDNVLSWFAQREILERICKDRIPFRLNYYHVWQSFDDWYFSQPGPGLSVQWKCIRRQLQKAADLAVNLWK